MRDCSFLGNFSISTLAQRVQGTEFFGRILGFLHCHVWETFYDMIPFPRYIPTAINNEQKVMILRQLHLLLLNIVGDVLSNEESTW